MTKKIFSQLANKIRGKSAAEMVLASISETKEAKKIQDETALANALQDAEKASTKSQDETALANALKDAENASIAEQPTSVRYKN